MTAEELLTYLSHQGIELWIDGDNLRYRGPRITLPPGLVALLKQHKAQLRELLLLNRQGDKDLFPLSYTQKSMWFLHQLNPSSTAYNVHFAAELTGSFSAPALQAALDKLGARHSSLRIRYVVRDGLPWQQVAASPSIPLTRLDASGWTEAEVKERVHADAYRPYDLLGEPPARVHLYKRSPTKQILLIGMHHIRVDGWSMAILVRELGILYRSEISGQAASLPPPGASFSDFVAWQQWLVQSTDGSAQLAYWTQELGGELPPLELPTDRPRPPVRSERGASVPWSLDAESSRRLKSLAAAEGVTPFSVLLSVLATFLYRYTGQEEILIGTPYHGRSIAKWNDVVACLLNTIVLHVKPRGDQSFLGLLREVHNKTNEALTHADHPFPLLVEKLRPERELSRTPLFQVLFAYENFQGVDAVSALLSQREGARAGELFGLAAEPIPLDQQEGQFDLTLRVMEGGNGDGDGFFGSFCFSTDLFERETAERMLSHFERLLRSALANPGESLSALELLAAEERHRLLVEWNRTEADYPKDKSLVDLFEAQAQQSPEATALSCGSQHLSYRELDLRANQLAHLLRSCGVRPEGLVGLCIERSFEMVVALLGILKAGAAYVPLDPSLPTERLSTILSDAGISLLLTRSSLLARLPTQAVRILCPFEAVESDDASAALSAQPTSKLPSPVPSESLAYVIYTSGSTGRPKGVMIPHRGLINYLWWCQKSYPVSAGEGAPVHSTLSFDLTVTSLWAPLVAGRPVHLLPEGAEVDTLKNALLQQKDYSLVKLTPAHLELLNHQLRPEDAAGRTRSFVIGGESLLASQVSFWRDNAPDTLLFNEYGPTETVVGCCVYQIKREDPGDGSIPIGRPIANTRLYVLDARSEPVPIGVPGELYIGGACVGRGYLNQPELSAQRFVRDPFSTEPGARMYRTGDLCRYRRDGNLEFLGRLDQQVKLRGYRIELGEIESVLASHPSISSCCVLLREDAPADKRLVAYFVPSAGSDPGSHSLRSHLAARLPEYMLPSSFVRLDALPLTANGKLDRRALPLPSVEGNAEAQLGPSSPIEQLLAEVFREVLRREHIPLSASFFDLGGHSLLAMQLVSRLRKLCEVELPIQAVFESPSLGALAERVRASLAGGLVPLPQVRPLGPRSEVRMSFAQQRLWLLQALEPDSCAYNIPMQWKLTGALDVDALKRCLDALAERHEVLRARVALDAQEPQLRITPRGHWPLQQAEVRGAAEAERVLSDQARRPFALGAEPPMRAVLVRVSDTEHWLQLNVHHMAFDGWSQPILLRELGSLYDAERSGRTAALPALEIRYADYAEAQRDWLSGGLRAKQLGYWKQQLTPLPDPLELPTDRPRPGRLSGAGAWTRLALDEKTTSALKALCRREGVTPFMALLAAYAITLSRYTGQHEFAIGTPIAGRPRLELEPIIGCFINTLVLRADLSGSPSFLDVLKRIKEKALGAYAHAEIPFEVLVEELNPPRDTGRSPLFQAMFLLQGEEALPLALGGTRTETLMLDVTTVKFDLTLALWESTGSLSGVLAYSTDLFDATTIERLGQHFKNILQAVVKNPKQDIFQLDIQSAADRQRLLSGWNPEPLPVREGDTFPRLFLEQVARTPDALALAYGEDSLTYRGLAEQATRLAHRLQALGIGPESRVALCLDRSLELVVGIVAIWLAGGTYVPLDPRLPGERLQHLLQDSAAAVLVTQRRYAGSLARSGLPEIFADDPSSDLSPVSAPQPALSSSHAAYCIYTSGSTGRPRGVLVQHGSLIHLTRTLHAALLPASVPPLRATLNASVSFDASIKMLALLLRGDSLHVVPSSARSDAALFVAWSRSQRIDLIDCTPSILMELVSSGLLSEEEHVPAWLWIGGEAIPDKLWTQLQKAPRTRSINLYGPTECTVDSTVCEIGRGPERPVIGRPFGNVRAYVLDTLRQPVPIGVFGELYLSGPGVARGYLNQPILTAEKFLPDPFHPGQRMYRTGDRARFLSDGNIEFQGRLDFQVKLRGYRIELGEIESVLSAHAGISSCAVLLREEAPGDKRLVAYFVPSASPAPDSHSLRSHLAARLPEYMLPSAFVRLDALPLTPSGKLDRRALPAPDVEGDSEPKLSPSSPIEQLLAEVFREVLRKEHIPLSASFFDLGGHSLLAMQLVSRLRKLCGVEIPVQAVFESPSLGALAERVRASLSGGHAPLLPVRSVGPRSEVRMSFTQQRLWLLQALDPGSCTYNIPMQWKLTGALDAAALQRCLDALSERHEVLRARVVTGSGEPLLRILPHGCWPLQSAQVRSAAEAERVLYEQARRPFALEAEPPVRAALVRLSEQEHFLQLCIHHMAFDGWSRPVLLRELGALYGAERSGTSAELPALTIDYADYAAAQREWLTGEVRARQLGYWEQILTPLPAVLELPSDRPRPQRPSGAGAWCRIGLEESTVSVLKELCRREGVTPFMALLAAYVITLGRYSGQDDFAIGTPIAGRTHVELEGLIGCFINTLVLRVDLSGEPSYREVLRRLKERALGAYAHAELPFEVLIEELNPPRDTSRSPLFQVMFVLQDGAEHELSLSGTTVEALHSDHASAKFDLTLALWERAGRMDGFLEFSKDLFDEATIARFGSHFRNVLRAALAEPDQQVSRLPLLSEEERQRILVDWNRTQEGPLPALCIHQLFEEQVKRSPGAPAVTHEGRTLTYGELDERAERLAARLHELGVRPGALAALCMERSIEMVVGLLAILKSGGAYLPIDLQNPGDRITFMLEDAAPAALLVDATSAERLPELRLPKVFVSEEPDAEESDAKEEPRRRLSAHAAPKDLAYVLYTSGSTGRPKAVAVEHGSLVNLLFSVQELLQFGSADVLLMAASLSFDVTVLELWLPLVTGARIMLAPAGTARDGAALSRLLTESQATLLIGTPSGWRALLDAGWQGDPGLQAIVGGEALPSELADFLAAHTAVAWNLYGPTETTVCSTYKRLSPGERPVSIGRPIANTQIYILDPHQQPVPIGVPGEIYIGGAGVARGYLNRPERTAYAFVSSPFAELAGQKQGARLYKTRDLARFLPDGSIEFLGRTDHQVKLRGFRIELGEIESVLSSHPAIKSCAVLLREDTPGNQRLCAYAVLAPASAAADVSELRVYLEAKLPPYMIPTAFVFLDSMPLSTNGKLDRKALPPPSAELDTRGYVAPRTSREQLVATAFAQVLDLPRVGIHDSFFDLGGHSLLAVRLIAELSRLTGQSIPFSVLFEHPTVAALLQELDQEPSLRAHKTLVLLQPAESSPPLFCIHPVGGHVLCYVELASSFQPPQKVYGVQASPVTQAPEAATLNEVSSRYVAAIRSIQPQGPYQLLGWSLGGVLAFEMARQLKLAGEEVSLLALLDAYAPDANLQQDGAAYSEPEVQRWFLRNLTGERLSESDAEPLPEDLARLQRALDHGPPAESPLQDRYEAQLAALYALFRRNVEMERSYRPESYDGRVLLLRAAERTTTRSRDCGWASLCTGELEIVDVPGDHYTLLSPANIPGLMRLLSARLLRPS